MNRHRDIKDFFFLLLYSKKGLLRLANDARDARDWENASINYRRFLAKKPKSFGVWVQLGHCHKELGQLPAALAAYKKAEQLNKDDVDLKVQLGHFFKEAGNHADAIAYYKSAIQAGSDDVHALHYIATTASSVTASSVPSAAGSPGQAERQQADAARDAGDFKAAARLYQRVVQRDPNDADAFVQLGNCLKDIGRLDGAEQAYIRAIELRPADADCYLQLGHLMKLAGRPADARTCYLKSDALDPSRPDARREIGNLQRLEAARAGAPRIPPPVAAVRDIAVEIPERAALILRRYQHALAQRRH